MICTADNYNIYIFKKINFNTFKKITVDIESKNVIEIKNINFDDKEWQKGSPLYDHHLRYLIHCNSSLHARDISTNKVCRKLEIDKEQLKLLCEIS